MSGIQHLQRCHTDLKKSSHPFVTPSGYQNFEKGGFLTFNGEDTGYIYAAVRDKLSIFTSNGFIDNSTLLFELSFGSQATVIDCVYFALNDHCPGIVVLINDSSLDKKEFYVAYVSLTKKAVLKKIILGHNAASLFSVCDGVRYKTQVSKLHKIFQDHWPHILAVSCYGVGAILIHFGITDEDFEVDDNFHKAPHTITLGKLFLDKNSDKFVFRGENDRRYGGYARDLYVTTFAFIEKSGIIVMGFPFGGIFTVSLRNQKQKQYFLMEAVVEDITIQFADDDPRGLFYVWFVFGRNTKYYVVSAQCIFIEEEEKNGNYDNPNLFFGLSFPLKDCIQFINVRTIAVEKTKLAASSRVSLDASQDDSIIGNSKSLSLSLYTWYGQPNENEPIRIYGALFDLNMYYTKRVPNAMNPDSSYFRQIPFVSGFVSDDTIDLKKVEVMDLIAVPRSFMSFNSVDSENIDQLFYPSAMSFCINVLTSVDGFYMQVNSIQDEYLMKAGNEIVHHWNNPTEMCVKLNALGLCDRPFEGNDRRYYLLNTFLRHGYHGDVINLVNKMETTYVDLRFISKWLSREVENSKEKLDKCAEPLFAGDGVSHSSFYFISYSETFFLRVMQLLDALLNRMQQLEKEEQCHLLKVAHSVAKGIHQYAIGIKFGLAYRFLPQKPMLNEINWRLKKDFRKKCMNAEKNQKELSILKLIRECMSATKSDSLWDNKSAESWYPPENYSSWLGVLLNVDLSISAKVTLFGYYLTDIDNNECWTITKLFDKSLGYFLHLEHDKLLGIKRKVDKMYKTDLRLGIELMNTESDVNVVEQDSLASTLEKLSEIPLMTREDAKKLKEKYLVLPYGLHYWNLLCIEKRKYELIQVVGDSPNPNEPEDVKASRIEVQKIKGKYPWLFRENKFLPMVEKYFAGEKQESPEPAKKIEVVPLKRAKKRTIEEVDDTVEENFVMVTPVKRDRKSLFLDTPAAKAFDRIYSDTPTDSSLTISPVVNADIVNASVSKKQWDKIRQLTRTPPATPLVPRNCSSPEPSTPRPAPTSILKSNKKVHPRIQSTAKKARLQFEESIAEVRPIPNRYELKAQHPDQFTMDDSMTSEPDTNHPNEVENVDISVGPVVLDLDVSDNDEDTIMTHSKSFENPIEDMVHQNDEISENEDIDMITTESSENIKNDANPIVTEASVDSKNNTNLINSESSEDIKNDTNHVTESSENIKNDTNPIVSQSSENLKNNTNHITTRSSGSPKNDTNMITMERPKNSIKDMVLPEVDAVGTEESVEIVKRPEKQTVVETPVKESGKSASKKGNSKAYKKTPEKPAGKVDINPSVRRSPRLLAKKH